MIGLTVIDRQTIAGPAGVLAPTRKACVPSFPAASHAQGMRAFFPCSLPRARHAGLFPCSLPARHAGLFPCSLPAEGADICQSFANMMAENDISVQL